MYIHFSFLNGSNPYIVIKNAELWRMIRKYETHFNDLSMMLAVKENPNPPKTYEEKKNFLRDFAIMWQYAAADFVTHWSEAISWADFFTEYGQRLGLLREFRENGIC